MLDSWKSIRASIIGLKEMLSVALMGHKDLNVLPEVDSIITSIRDRVQEFENLYRQQLPSQCLDTIRNFLEPKTGRSGIFNQDLMVIRFAPVMTFMLEMDALLSDIEQPIKTRTDRAFLHLQNSILVSEHIREEWMLAFNVDETACEKLGAVHLLSHGIYAFKADGARGRTDLVLNNPVDDELASRVAEGLVLTEWKKVSSADASDKASEARKQTLLYVASTIQSLELKSLRYVVLVSERKLSVDFPDQSEGGVTFRHINLVVNPDTPSVTARR